MNKSSITLMYQNPGVWGPVTATLDWCEANYQFTRYIAELANSTSNVITVGLAVHGANTIWSQNLPLRYLIGFLAIAVVGLGSFAFHATLLYTAQLADELPMIYAASCCFFIVFDTAPGFKIRSKFTLVAMILFDILFTWSYWIYRNPIYHQVVFAGLMLSISARSYWLLRHSKASARVDAAKKDAIFRIYQFGSASFVLGFAIWNLDNIFCDVLTKWKGFVNWPAAFLLEGHSWWHVLTGLGTYLMWIGTVYLTVCIKDDPSKYTLTYDLGFLPQVRLYRKMKL